MRYSVVVRSQPGEHLPVHDGVGAPASGIPDDPEPRSCSETTKAGDPCKGRAGDDGLCAAHKGKESDAAPA